MHVYVLNAELTRTHEIAHIRETPNSVIRNAYIISIYLYRCMDCQVLFMF